MSIRISKTWLIRLWIFIAICLPCVCMWDLDGMYPDPAEDWVNQLWMFSYQANHIAMTGTPANVFNYEHATGLNIPPFYGTLMYPFGGVVSLVLGPALALRALIFGSFALEYIILLRMGRGLGWSLLLRHTVAISMVWAVYPLVNIYDRGALPEFWGFIFVVASLACFLRYLKAPSHPSTTFDRYAWGFFFLLCCSTHPLTATVGGTILVGCGCIGFWGLAPAQRWPFIRNGLLVSLCWLVAQSPWLWLTLIYGRHLVILQSASKIFSWFSSVLATEQQFWTPIVPLTFTEPTILLTIFRGGRVATPLILLIVGLIIMNRKKIFKPMKKSDCGLFTFGLFLAGLSYAIMTIPPVAVLLSPLVGFMQLGYRFNNFVNLGLLIALAGWPKSSLSLLTSDTTRNRAFTRLMQICILVAGIAVISKLSHVTEMQYSGGRWLNWQKADIHGIVPSFYGIKDYVVVENLPENKIPDGEKKLDFVTQPDNPDMVTADVTLSETKLMPTRVIPFPWNQIWVNGAQLTPPALGVFNTGEKVLDQDKRFVWIGLSYYTVTLPPGSYHLEYRFCPPPAWLFLRELSFIIAAIWGSMMIWLAIREVLPVQVRRVVVKAEPIPSGRVTSVPLITSDPVYNRS